jgi:hypothetical protein
MDMEIAFNIEHTIEFQETPATLSTANAHSQINYGESRACKRAARRIIMHALTINN